MITKYRVNKAIFLEQMKANNLATYKALADKAKVAPASISNSLNRGCSARTVMLIGQDGFAMGNEWLALLVDKDRRRLEPSAPDRKGTCSFTWEQLEQGAKEIAKRLFDDLHINTVLTFPGPSLIFTGLVMAKASRGKAIIRVPVYTAIFAAKDTPSREFPNVDRVPMERFDILVPRGLMANYRGRKKRIAVIDDAIITGKTMDELRQYFVGHTRTPDSVAFACYVCYSGRLTLRETTPIYVVAREERMFRMPWGDAFPFEYGFEVRKRRHR